MKTTAAVEIEVLPKGGADTVVKNFKQQLKDAKNEAQQMVITFGEFSNEALAAQKKVAELSDKMDDFNDRVKALNPDKFAKVQTVVNGVASGFAAAQGAMALFGTESEDLTKSLVKVQGAMALAQGLEGLGKVQQQFTTLAKDTLQGVIKAFSTLKGAIISTGIGALVVGLGLLITYWDDIQEALGGVSKEQSKVNNAMRDAVAAEQGNISKLQSYQKLTQDTSLSLAERKNALGELNKLGIETRDIDVTSAASMNILNARITDNIKLIQQRAKATALEKIIAEESEIIFREKNKSLDEELSLFDKYKASLFTFTAAQYNANKADIAKANQTGTITKSQKTLNTATVAYDTILKQLNNTNQKVEQTTTQVSDAYEKQSSILQNKLITQTTALDKAKALELSNLNLTERQKLEIENKYANLSTQAKQDAIKKEQKITGLITDPKERLAQETKLKQDLATLDVTAITQKTSYSQSLKDLGEKDKAEQEKIAADLKASKEKFIAADLQQIKEQFQKEIDYVQERDAKLLDQTKTKEQIAAIELKSLQAQYDEKKRLGIVDLALAEQISAKKTELTDKELAEQQKLVQQKQQTINDIYKAVEDSLNAISELNSAFAGQSEEEQKKAFELDKTLKFASTVLSTIQGAQNAYTSALGSPLTAIFPAYPFIQMGAAYAVGIANLKKISSTSYQSKSVDKANPSQASGQGTMPSFAPRMSSLNQNESLTQDRKVYVTEGDITRTQRRVSNNQAISVVE